MMALVGVWAVGVLYWCFIGCPTVGEISERISYRKACKRIAVAIKKYVSKQKPRSFNGFQGGWF